MMTIRFPALLALFVLGWRAPAGAQPSLYPDLLGKSYTAAKQQLIALGARPTDVRKYSNCWEEWSVCSLPEAVACAADHPLCLMAWKGKDGRIFTVETSWKVEPSVSDQEIDWIWFGDPR